MAGRCATKRGCGGATRAISFDENRAVLDEQVGEIKGAFGL